MAASHVLYVNSCASSELGLRDPCVPWDCVYFDSLEWGWDYVGAVPLFLGNAILLPRARMPSPLRCGISLIAALFHLSSTQPLQQDKDQRIACDEVLRCSQINSYRAGRCWQGLGSLHAGSLPGQGGRWTRRHHLLSCSLGRSDGRAGSRCSR